MKRRKLTGSGSPACWPIGSRVAAGLRRAWGIGSARRRFSLTAIAAVCLAAMPVDWHPQFRLATGLSALAQQAAANPNGEDEEEEDTRPLYQREPFDLITLKKTDGGEVIKVLPVKRPLPRNPGATATLQFSRFEQRNQKYEVAWRNIESVKLFEESVLEEAEQLLKEQQFDLAYPYFAFLLKYHAGMPRLEDSVNLFLLTNAVASFGEKKYIEMFSMLEELHRSSPRYQSAAVMRGLDQAAGALLKQHMDGGNIAAAQMLLARLESTYKDAELPAIVTWRGELSRLAAVKRDAAKQAIADDKMREAYKFVQEMMQIYPKVPGGPELAQQVVNKYPIAYVGVTQPVTVFEPSRIDNWSARRSGRLLNRMLLEFRQPGGEGGEYSFPLGTISISEDRQQLMLRVASSINGVPTSLSGYEVSRRLIELATIGHPDYTPSWASLVADVHVSNVFDVYVDFRRPHVLPQAMLLTRFDTVGEGLSGGDTGSYRIAEQTETETQFLLKPDYPHARAGQPKEIIEQHFQDPQSALQALLRGELDVLDQVYPADALKLQKGRKDIEVRQYAMPQVHMLVPVSDHPYLANRNFRRAIVYAINREQILSQELLNNAKIPGCQVVSGPFPAGRTTNDPLGYAYDLSIKPLPFNARLGFALALTAQFEIKAQGEKRGEKIGDLIEGIPQPEDPDLSDADRDRIAEQQKNAAPVPPAKPLVIGHPAHEIARVACQAIQQQLESIKIPCTLKELPPGMSLDPEDKCDLVYITAAVWEPIVDARRLLGPDGIARSNNPYINLQLRMLESARSWKDVRNALHDLHSRVAGEMIVLPLWQMTDYFAYRKGVRGIGDGPVSLYQDIEQWSLSPQIKVD